MDSSGFVARVLTVDFADRAGNIAVPTTERCASGCNAGDTGEDIVAMVDTVRPEGHRRLPVG